jgi:hypothetical protein
MSRTEVGLKTGKTEESRNREERGLVVSMLLSM